MSHPVQASSSTGAGATNPPAPPERNAGRKNWGTKLDDRPFSDMGAMAHEIPRKDLGPSIEAWFDSYGIGGLDSATVNKAWALIDAWVAEDFDSAWSWANSIQQPATRQFIITAIAGSLAESDPHRAYDCLVSNGEFGWAIRDGRLMTLVQNLSKESLSQSPEKFVEFWKRFPLAKDSVNSFMGVQADPGPGTDFLALQQAMDRELGSSMARPINPTGVIAAWTKTDPEAALDYVINRAKTAEDIRDAWSEMRGAISQEKGRAATEEWTLGVLRGLEEGERGNFILAAGAVNMPGLRDLLREGATPEESSAWMRETLQLGVERGNGQFGIASLISDLPMEQRIGILKGLHGPKAFEAVKNGTPSWNLTESQMEEIRQAIEAR
ncbi:hypothetical protein [Haloferula sp. BvORR071]|uniref:hypothetical protein n=1 Tax=Haloferula sp. BvORR071 TaxID=1396141 RepID=UPI00055551C4|nr:hypothetical protein [Haloferula sp. BvORR071]